MGKGGMEGSHGKGNTSVNEIEGGGTRERKEKKVIQDAK